MAAPTLNDEHRNTILEGLCAGKTDTEIIAGLETQFGVTCTPQNLTHYRDKWKTEVDEAEGQRYEAAKRRGWASATKRIISISKVLDKLEGTLEYASPGQIAQGRLGQEFREMLKELRTELGLDKQRVELTGAEGTPLQVVILPFADTGSDNDTEAPAGTD